MRRVFVLCAVLGLVVMTSGLTGCKHHKDHHHSTTAPSK
jgi:hypothetical protein